MDDVVKVMGKDGRMILKALINLEACWRCSRAWNFSCPFSWLNSINLFGLSSNIESSVMIWTPGQNCSLGTWNSHRVLYHLYISTLYHYILPHYILYILHLPI